MKEVVWDHGVTIRMGGAAHAPVRIFLLEPESHAAAAMRRAGELGLSLVLLDGWDWENDMTPWKAPGVFKKAGSFGDGAEKTLALLEKEIIPETDRVLGEAPVSILGGISLAGLFTIYAGTRSSCFDGLISLSGSLWYDHFKAYMEEHAVNQRVKHVYLSLGVKEKKTRNPRMARVEDCTKDIKAILETQHIPTVLEMNPGNHFSDYEERIEKALVWAASVDWHK
jgi:predicted alpha/beta superfamily hydrolase